MMQRFMRFMYGRYGMDEFNFFLLVFAMVVLIIAIFVPVPASLIIRLIALAATAFAVFRALSKNRYARNKELKAYNKIRFAITGVFKRIKIRFSQRKTHGFYRCPECKTTVRVPKGRGKIRISCPKCGNTFIRKS